MFSSEYAAFVRDTDQSVEKAERERRDIAIYGLAAEIGSLLSAVKKAMLAAQGDQSLVAARKREEVKEEIGDVLWYSVSLGQLTNLDPTFNVFSNDIRNLHAEISADDQRAAKIETVLTHERKAEFLDGAVKLIAKEDFTLDEYQQLAFLTARTEGELLQTVCLAVLTQLGAEVLRNTLPDIEHDLNQKLADRDLNVVLGEIVWHLAAVSTLSGLWLSEIAQANREKVMRRYGRGQPTPLHDDLFPQHEQFPRKFEVSFVNVGKGRSRMYFDGQPLGSELTDNATEEDGYRFHDVMHLAILAKLGWSPVIRKLMKRKRKSDPKVDEVQDGARAQIVEELIIKSIHSEGTAHLDAAELSSTGRLFANRGLISFSFLSQTSRLASGLEAGRNQLWEWEEAILDGSRLFQMLRQNGQGTVGIDLNARTIGFDKNVYVELPGTIVGVGSSAFETDTGTDSESGIGNPDGEATVKEAVLMSLGLDGGDSDLQRQIDVQLLPGGGLVVRAGGLVQAAMWKRRAISFRVTRARVGAVLICTAFAMADPRDTLVG